MRKTEITKILKKIESAEVQNGKYGNGNLCEFKRLYEDDKEYTLVDGKLYMGIAYFDGEKDTYSTVTRIKEGRREDGLEINGVNCEFACMIANSVRNANEFFKTC